MTPDEPNFNDPQLKQALRRQAPAQRAPDDLRRSVEALFDAPPALSIQPRRTRFFAWSGAVAAALLVGVIVFVSLNGDHHDDEYLIPEPTLWSAIASLHGTDQPIQTTPASTRAAMLPNAELVGSNEQASFAGVPAVLTRYRTDDTTFTLVLADARKVLADTDETESYHEYVGDYQLVGGNRGDDWVCVVADKSVPVELLKRVAADAQILTPSISGQKNP